MPMNIWSLSYLHSLVDLHNQISLGKGDDQEADDIRDGMDVPCRKMSENDTDITSMISVLLYMLDGQDKEPTPRTAAKDKAWKLLVLFVSDSQACFLEKATELLQEAKAKDPGPRDPYIVIRVNGKSTAVPTAERLTYEKICELAGDSDHVFSVVWGCQGRSGTVHKGSPDIRPEKGLRIEACDTGNA